MVDPLVAKPNTMTPMAEQVVRVQRNAVPLEVCGSPCNDPAHVSGKPLFTIVHRSHVREHHRLSVIKAQAMCALTRKENERTSEWKHG